MHTYLLCRPCEERLSRNGEHYALRWIGPKTVGEGSFPLLDRLNIALPRLTFPSFRGYAGSTLGIDTERLAYFAVSILWRSAIRSWPLPDGSGFTTPIYLDEMKERIREYLLGSEVFPSNLVVVLTVCTDHVSRNMTFTPTRATGTPYNQYSFQTFGLRFDTLIGSDLSSEIHELCCVSSYNKWIFASDRENQSTETFKFLLATSRPSPNLMKGMNV